MDIISMFLIFLSTVLLKSTVARRVQVSDSILDIIDTRNVQRLLAERRANESRQSKRFLIQNNMRHEQQRQQPTHDDHNFEEPSVYQPEVINFDFNERHSGLPIRGEIVTYNDTIPTYNTENQDNADLLNDLQAYRGDKILKSSKNALYITRKEYLKKDWCKTEPLIQRIKEEGCLTRTIINRFCYGQCNSFYIPKGPSRRRRNNARRFKSNGDFEDEDLTGAMFKSCAFCKPKKFAWVSVTLRCPSMVPQLRRKRIQRIKQCRCMAEPLD